MSVSGSADVRLSGLDPDEAALRLRRIGPNIAPRPPRRTFRRIILETAREPMFLLLLAATVVYLIVGDLGEGLFLMGGALLTVTLVVIQEARSERVLAALSDLSEPVARVIRGGEALSVPARDIVDGDLVLLAEGQRAPADGTLVSVQSVSVDEAILTGESAPVLKSRGVDDSRLSEPADASIFAGTMIVGGQGVMEVTATGASTALGRIGASLAAIRFEPTPLQIATGRVVRRLGGLAIIFCAVVAFTFGLVREDWVGGFLAGLTLAIALLPEEFPMVLAVFLAIGAWRLARRNVLVRRSAVIETLGCASVLCVDKTGTLTLNRMEVERVFAGGREADRPSASADVPQALAAAAHACSVRPTDPMDMAILSLPGIVLPAGDPIRVWPLHPSRPVFAQAWAVAQQDSWVAAKGAPEAILQLCALDDAEEQDLRRRTDAYAAAGYRVLAVASARVSGVLPDDIGALSFGFEGLIAFADPIRPGVREAIDQARLAGVRVVMITGDHPATARAIAAMCGLDGRMPVVTGAELAGMSEADVSRRVADSSIFARVRPEQKLRLVEALKRSGEVVAMTGDGVNDAPALEAAHIGVAMGKRGSDVAREAADLVLLDDSFSSIVGGIRTGRRIFANLRRALIYITAIHVPIAGLALLPLLAGLPPLLYPMHVVLLELAIDPLCALVFEQQRSERGAMSRPPRRLSEPLFRWRDGIVSFLEGGGVLAAVFLVYVLSLRIGGTEEARGAAFLTLVMANIILAVVASALSARRLLPQGAAFWGISITATALLALALLIPELSGIFEMAAPSVGQLAIAAGALAAITLWSALATWLGRARRSEGGRENAPDRSQFRGQGL
jgi:Ca2+-transporting ATPase